MVEIIPLGECMPDGVWMPVKRRKRHPISLLLIQNLGTGASGRIGMIGQQKLLSAQIN